VRVLPESDARAAVAGLVHAYAERLDAGDLDGVADLFARATWRSTAGTNRRGAAEVRRAYDPVIRYADGSPRTKHVITNLVIDVAPGGDKASSTCLFTVLQGLPDQPVRVILAGHYRDQFAADEHGWYFTDRLIEPHLVGGLSRHMGRGPTT
jgi:hypothetical protein